ncbi:MAG: hypothetical protein V1750_01250 [Acidobacteriota bacterium]
MPLRISMLAALLLLAPLALAAAPAPAISPEALRDTIARLVARYGEPRAARIRQGVTQAAERWWEADGDTKAFADFCETNFVTDPAVLAASFARLERVLEQVDGHLHEVRRELLTPLDLDTGPVGAADRLLADLDLAAHVNEDLFSTKVAFFALLNFPVHRLAERLQQGASWDRETWARSVLMDRFALRVPATVSQEITRATTAADQYIASYNIFLGNLRAGGGERLFPEDLRLITHWGLRDELKSHYGEAGGLEKQRLIQRVMERILRQEIPAAVIDNPALLWDPQSNEVKAKPGETAPAPAGAREPDTRYTTWLDCFKALRKADPFSPTAPTAIARSYELGRQVPEQQVAALFESVLASSELAETGRLIARRLGRPLEPFDIWYDGFMAAGKPPEAELDRLVAGRYPSAAAFQAALPDILTRLGFTAERAAWLAERIVVDPSRGAGHAMAAQRREDKAHLRTRVAAGGMTYKGFNIAVHELGHNVEQVFSLNGIDHWALAGVPANGFTEAFAFAFQARDLELLGLGKPAQGGGEEALHDLWATAEIAAVALVDTKVWHWLYDHPEATPAELREAVLASTREVWNRYWAPVVGVADSDLLAIYSHMVAYPLYLPDYPLGHIIAFQVAERLRAGDFGKELERLARQGRLTPEAWMQSAVGGPISSKPLLAAAREALSRAR